MVSYQLSQVYPVTTLNEFGPGSLKAAPSNAYVVFPNLTGTMNWQQAHKFTGTNDLWVLGQTGDIEIRGGQGTLNPEGLVDLAAVFGHIWQYLRVRVDDPADPNNCCHKAFGVLDSSRIVLDHLSMAYGDDGNLDVYRSTDVTVSECIEGPGLYTPAKRSRGSLIGRGARISFLRNLVAHNAQRQPLFQDIVDFDHCNSVSFDTERGPEYQSIGWNNQVCQGNVECNIHIPGPTRQNAFWQDFGAQNTFGQLRLYVQDNKVLINAGADCNSAPGPYWFDAETTDPTPPPDPANPAIFVGSAFNCPRLKKLAVCDTLDYVLENAGASHRRDSVDDNLVSDVRNHVGGYPSTAGPWSNPTGTVKDPWDDSNPDMLSDAIKMECGLDPANHRNTVQTNTNGGSNNDFLYIMNYCFGL